MINIICNAILTQENKKEIQQMINTGLTAKQIVEKLNVSIEF